LAPDPVEKSSRPGRNIHIVAMGVAKAINGDAGAESLNMHKSLILLVRTAGLEPAQEFPPKGF
jgi:hypothetical protein